MTHLVLSGLSKRYGDQLAVDGISLSIAQGEFVSLLGPSGCGKTTTLQMIAGFVEPTAGSIRIDGRDLLAIPASKRGLGIVFQNYALFPHLSVTTNIAFGLEMRQVAKAERMRRVADTLALVGLTGLSERYPAQLSGGQQQRVALARALVIQPELLLLDEPLSNLDAKLREEMQVELARIQRTIGITTLMVTHDQGEALALSDRVVVMHAGRIEQEGFPVDAYENPASGFVCDFLGKSNRFTIDRIDGVAATPAPAAVTGDDAAAAVQAIHAIHAIHSSDALRSVDAGPRKTSSGPPGTGIARMGPLTIALPPAVLARVKPGDRLLVRPEKIGFGPPGPAALPAKVASRVFQGNHWLYQFETALGVVLVIRQNDGSPQPATGESVHLVWRAADMRAVPGDPQ